MTTMNTTGTQSLGNGYFDHGVAATISNHRGTAVTVDADGRDVVLVWLYDHRGGYSLLLIDAETGETEQFPTPFPIGGDGPFAALLSSRNRYYTHFNSHFVEFDVNRRAYTAIHESAPQMSMGMTEDDRGRIWSVTYPKSGVTCYDPETGAFRDYGHVYDQNWPQYARSVAADDAGWIYFGVGNTASQIIVLDPDSGEARPVLDESQRALGTGYVYRDLDGKVYGRAHDKADTWLAFHSGQHTTLTGEPPRNEKPIITGSQGLFHREFPSGKRLETCDLIERVLEVSDPATGKVHRVSFDYASEGPRIVTVIAGPDNAVRGGTMFPMRCFQYNPADDSFTNHDGYGQWNTSTRTADRLFIGCYTHGFLLEWDPAKPFVTIDKDNPDSNPRWLTECEPIINRPHALIPYGDDLVIMGGTPGYGYTGGGLLFWDRRTQTPTLLDHHDVLPEHSTMSLAALPDGKLLGGSTTDPGTGGERKAEQAELYIMDVATKRVEWHEPVLPGKQYFACLCPTATGDICGIADGSDVFIFNPRTRKLVHHHDTTDTLGGFGYQQGPRKLLPAPDGSILVLFNKGIARFEPDTGRLDMLAESPVTIRSGGDVHDGRVYFGDGSHLYSYVLPTGVA